MTTYRLSAYNGTEFMEVSPTTEGFTALFLSGGTAYYRNDGVFGGSVRFTGQAGLQHDLAFASTTLYWRGYFKIDAIPTSNRMFVSWENASSTAIASMGVDTSSKWRLRNASGVTTATSVTTFIPGDWYGILYQFNPTTGAQSARFYLEDGTFFEEIVGTGTPGTVTRQREGVLQGNNTTAIWLDGTATADTVLDLIGDQIDPEDPEPTDPYRVSPYDGTIGGPLQLEDGNGYYSAFDGIGVYSAPGFAGGTSCGRYSGQYALRCTDVFGSKIWWTGWLRFQGYPDTNRIISVFWDSSMTIQAAVGIDTAGKWRLRALNGSTVATSNRALTANQWYGVSWMVDRTAGIQTLTIYSYFGSVLEVLSGTVATGAYTQHLEGGVQGRPTWWVDMDTTQLHSQYSKPVTPLTEIASNLVFRNGRSPTAPQYTAMYWDGASLAPLTVVESF